MPFAAEMRASREEFQQTGLSPYSFRLLVESAADGVLVVDPTGLVLYANPAAADIFGKSPAALTQTSLGRPVVANETAELTVVVSGRQPTQVEMRVVEVTWDQRPALLATLRDVSAQRLKQERLQQAQKLEAIGRLTAGIAHDFNNLLAVIEASLRLLRKQLATDPTDPKVEELIDEVLRRTTNGSALTHHLVAFSRQQTLAPRTIELEQRINALSQLLGGTLGKGIRIEKDIDGRLEPVYIDPNQLDVAILNLAINARDAMEGRGTLTIKVGQPSGPIELPDVARAADQFVQISICDTGCGMSKDVVARVFEPFFTTKPDGEGTGLGLSQVYGFVTQSGGHVLIDSEIGRGTCVHLFLPKAAQDQLDTAPTTL